MLIKEMIEKKRVQFYKSFDSWEKAIYASYIPLLKDKSVNEDYVDLVINNVKKYGPYIIFTPHIAMPHAQENSKGVYKNGITLMKVEEPVVFDENDSEKTANIFISLASANHDIHLKYMKELADFLLQNNNIDNLLKIKNIEDLKKLY